MSETDGFLAAMIPLQIEADTALHNGNAAPRMALYSRRDPVTVLGAAATAVGWEDVSRAFEWLERTFSDCESFELEIIAAAASGDVAYTVGYEHTKATIDGTPRSFTLRVTHGYRREGGEWKIAHRHADAATAGSLADADRVRANIERQEPDE